MADFTWTAAPMIVETNAVDFEAVYVTEGQTYDGPIKIKIKINETINKKTLFLGITDSATISFAVNPNTDPENELTAYAVGELKSEPAALYTINFGLEFYD